MNAAIYARYSSDKQRTESATAQIQAGQRYCAQQSYTVVKEYVDEATTGTNDDRPEFQRMLTDAAAGLFQVLVVHKVDRFARNREDAAFNKQKLRKAKVRLEYVEQHLDGSAESVILESVLEGMAEYYSKNLAKETMKGLMMNAQNAQFNGGTPPLGYNVDENKKYVINEHEAEAVRLIFRLYADGMGLARISDELTMRGYKTKRGVKFAKNSLHDILRNHKYIGVYTFGAVSKTEEGTRNTHQQTTPKMTIKDAIPPIIDKDTWQAVQNKREENKKRRGANAARRTYLLSGLVFCGECGAAYIGNTSSPRGVEYSSYVCGKRDRKSGTCANQSVPKDELENKVVLFVKDYILKPENADALANKLNTIQKEQSVNIVEEINSLENEKKQTAKKIDNLLKAIEDGLYSPTIKTNMIENENRLRLIENRLTELNTLIGRCFLTGEQINAVLDKFRTVLAESSSQEDIKQVLNILVEKVVIEKQKQVDISIHLPVRVLMVPRTGIEPVRSSRSEGF